MQSTATVRHHCTPTGMSIVKVTIPSASKVAEQHVERFRVEQLLGKLAILYKVKLTLA